MAYMQLANNNLLRNGITTTFADRLGACGLRAAFGTR
jgi:hypothetical protein